MRNITFKIKMYIIHARHDRVVFIKIWMRNIFFQIKIYKRCVKFAYCFRFIIIFYVWCFFRFDNNENRIQHRWKNKWFRFRIIDNNVNSYFESIDDNAINKRCFFNWKILVSNENSNENSKKKKLKNLKSISNIVIARKRCTIVVILSLCIKTS